MENASKALIIAGAILISILLITIGIVLINSGRDVVDTGTSGMASQKIQTFNAQFTSYEGKKSGSELKSLFDAVRASNVVDEAHQITFTTGNGNIQESSSLVSSKQYTVTLKYSTAGNEATNTEKGYIYEITVAK